MNSAPKNEPNALEPLVRFLETDNGQRLSVCLFAIIATLILLIFPGGALALIVGIPFVFFVPGFTVVRLFFWKTTKPEAKLVLSMALSILVVIFLALFLVLTPIGLNSDSTRASLMTFSIASVALEAFVLPANRGAGAAPEQERIAPKPMKIDKVVAGMLGAALVVSAISLGLIITAEYPSRTYFAVTDENGKVLTNFSLAVNTTLTVVLHMKNGEDGARNFTVVGYVLDSLDYPSYSFSRTLQKGEEWNQTMTFDLLVTGNFRLDFDLYIQEELQPPYRYGNLHFWFGVFDFSQPI
ncbi:MAG: hypothetical protein A3K76_01120 [Euryarchaeota archaeon RBG_13_57_23]|nr:MAG: hypothetical protein A3K76_01120 [Euryarchaeota archaeon RBG_13_57_23]